MNCKTDFISFDEFKNNNFLVIKPQISKTKSKLKTKKNNKLNKKIKRKDYSSDIDENEENESKDKIQKIKNYLFNLSSLYINELNMSCYKTLHKKYEYIFQAIEEFLIKLRNYNDIFFNCLLINTDQNSENFFKSLEIYFNKPKIEDEKNNIDYYIIRDTNFDLKLLNKELSLGIDGLYKTEEIKIYKQRLIIIRDIAKLNSLELNVFLQKLMDYNEHIVKNHLSADKYSNIIIFDVTYDLNTLFNKIEPNILSKMIFNNLPYVSSKDIYKSIVYDFINKKELIFFPIQQNLQKILFYIDNYQISIKTFIHYFKYLIIEFFLFKNWNYSFIIYDWEIVKLKRDDILLDRSRIKEILLKRNVELELNIEEIEDILNYYFNIYNKRREFMLWFKGFSELIIKKYDEYYKNSYEENNESQDIKRKFMKEEFFFRYLFLGTSKDQRINKRVCLFIEEICKFTNQLENKNENVDDYDIEFISSCENFIKEDFKVQYELILNEIRKDNLKEELKEFFAMLIKNISIQESYEIIPSNQFISKSQEKLISTLNESKKTNIGNTQSIMNNEYSCIDNIKCNKIFKNWLIQLFNKANLDCWLNELFENYYFDTEYEFGIGCFNLYENIINPNFERIIMNDFKLLSLENFLNDKYNNELDNISKNTNSKIESNTKVNERKEKKRRNKMKILIEDDVKSNNSSQLSGVNDSYLFENGIMNINNLQRHQLYSAFIDSFGVLGYEFKLKYFFAEFLYMIGINMKSELDVNNNKQNINQLSLGFLKLCHEFYLLGFFYRKRGKNDIFIKNYYENKGFYET